MKLLFDENISFRILKKIESKFPESKHTLYHGLNGKTDTEIWDVAKKEELVIVTFDEDYFEMMMIKGFPPKVIWLRIGNSSTNEIVELLEKNFDEIKLFIQNNEVGLLELY
ncbi:MAG: hypothetical protein RI955_1057 [Bacteroidota bacterium]|jgi:predicted nuclease of predicted toxin-antitoxin system